MLHKCIMSTSAAVFGMCLFAQAAAGVILSNPAGIDATANAFGMKNLIRGSGRGSFGSLRGGAIVGDGAIRGVGGRRFAPGVASFPAVERTVRAHRFVHSRFIRGRFVHGRFVRARFISGVNVWWPSDYGNGGDLCYDNCIVAGFNAAYCAAMSFNFC